jgi:hypothetical protein
VVGAALMLLLAGCGGDPKADPPPSTSPTPSVSSTPSPPALPEAAKANTKAGAIAFVAYFVSVFNHAQMTGETGELSVLSSDNCRDCQAAIRGLNRIYGAGGHIDGGSLTPGPATAELNRVEHQWLVLVRIDSGPQSVTESAGTATTDLPGGRRTMQFTVTRSASGWEVTSWARA